MKILIPGGAGFIGSHVLLDLVSNRIGKEFIIIDNFSNSSKKIIDNIGNQTQLIESLDGKDITWKHC